MKHTKIIATIGPSSESKQILEEMVKEGMNVARLNFSHGDFSSHERIIKNIREISKKMKRPVGIIADLQGPRIRTVIRDNIKIKEKEILLVADSALSSSLKIKNSNKKVIYLDGDKIAEHVKNGSNILIEDGLIKLKVIKKEKNYLTTVVVDGGIIKNHKGVNIPDISSQLGALTLRDKEMLKFALRHDIDFVAMSFVRNAKEIEGLRKIIRENISRSQKFLPQIIAKIERKEAMKNFNEILKETDIIMVARGDLGIEMPQADLPILQKEMVAKCLRSGKPVIVATQMLDSMIHNPRPTRAEVSDVSNAVIDHTDAVMLSGETASGKYPVESVRTMREIIEKTEESPFGDLEHGFLGDKKSSVSASIAQSAHELSKDSGAKAIIVASISGFTARMIARHRPNMDFFVITNNKKTYNQLSLVWGAEGHILPNCQTLDELIFKSVELLKKNKLLKKKEKIVIVAGRPHIKKESMSLIKVEEIK
jgi:pyruvate kinase